MSGDAPNSASGISPQRLIIRRSLDAYGLPEGFYTLACAAFAHLCACAVDRNACSAELPVASSQLPCNFRDVAVAGFLGRSREAGPGSRAEKPLAPADGSNGLLLKNAHQILSVDVLVKRFR